MVTDGADTSDASLDESLASLKARSIPVFTVGVGQDQFAHDIQITRVETPRLDAERHVALGRRRHHPDRLRRPEGAAQRRRRGAHRQLAGGHAAARRRVDDGARDLHRQRRRRRGCSGSRSRRSRANRSRRTTRATRWWKSAIAARRVLYLEGEPRFEMKFIRRAVEDDKNLPVVILQRTAEDKYLRLDVGNPDEAGRRLSEDARGAVRLPRDHPRQRRGRVVLARPAPDARRLRQQARRRPADARRTTIVRRRRLGRHAGRRSAAGRVRRRAARQDAARGILLAAVGPPDPRRRDVSGDAARRDTEKAIDGEVGRHAGGQQPSIRFTPSSRAPRSS